MLRCINGLETSSGVITVADLEVHANKAELRALRQKVGMIFQQFNLFPHLTVRRNVMLALTVVKKIKQAEPRRSREACWNGSGSAANAMPIPRNSRAGSNSVWRSPALAMQPVALLCDEITSALDPELVNEVLAVMRDLANRGHDPDDGDARNALRTRSLSPRGIHAPGPGFMRSDRRKRFRSTRDTRTAAVSRYGNLKTCKGS